MEMLRVVLPVLVMLFIGMICREKKLMNIDGASALQALVMNFCLPANLFFNFYKNRLNPQTAVYPVLFFAVTVGGIFLGRFLCKLFKKQDVYLPFLTTGYEAGMLGYALVTLLVGADNLTQFAIMDVGHVVGIFTVYVAMLKAMGGEKQTAKEAVKGILGTPVLVGILSGFILGVTGIGGMIAATPVGPVIDSVCQFIAAPTSAVILVVIGFRMKFVNLDWKAVWSAIGLRLLAQAVWVAVVFGVLFALGGSFTEPFVILSAVIMLLLPPPFIIPLYIKGEKEKEFYSSTLSVYTLLTILAFLVLVAVTML